MGLYHCPMGAAFYDDAPCIDCGMCIAETEEEMVEASKKIRLYLQSQAPATRPVKKIAVSGKGGVGKSTVVALIAEALKTEGYTVIVLDTDESNPGLHRILGFNSVPKSLIRLMSRFSKGDPEIDTGWITREAIAIKDIPPDYVMTSNGLRFLMVGKIEDPFQGCACEMADITRDLMGKMALGEKEIAIVDMEAGIESFGRGLERNVDTILMIVEPSFESMALSEKISYMAQGMGINRILAILNKVPSEAARQKMTEELNKRKVKTVGAVYYDPLVSEAGFEGKPPGGTKALEDVQEIVRIILNDSLK
jgi:CO dehydrogenase maturation factor